MRWSKLTRALTLSLALAAGAMVMPQLATPAHAGSVVSRFNEGDVVKIKTIWGGGFVLNFGGTAGSPYPAVQAKVHWNTSWDHPNRFQVGGPWYEAGFSWHMLMSRQNPHLCLTVRQTNNRSFVTQERCDINDNSQYWSGEWWPGYSTVWIRNLAHHRANLTTVLSQVHFEYVGSQTWMENLVNARSRQEWEVHSCVFNGVEQKDC